MSSATVERYAKELTGTVGGTVSGATDSARDVTDNLLGGEEKQR
jgi:hypothetical protein